MQFQGCSSGFQGFHKRFRGFSGFSGHFREFLGVPGGFKAFDEISGTFQGVQAGFHDVSGTLWGI